MKVTSKGQVTIPLDVRQKTGIQPGSEIEFVEEDGRFYLAKVEGSGRERDMIRQMTGKGKVAMSTDEILALTRGDD